ncbi:hypothetical protein [Peribacillus muralis]|uniref:hypothetical protein n=1 Tax=Peribacillus muralis TaxID=264697 RepID=UPI003670AA56
MHKSERYLYEKRPDWDKTDKTERKQLRKAHRIKDKVEISLHDFKTGEAISSLEGTIADIN